MKYAYFVVEGPHDVEVIGRILKQFGAKRIKREDDLDPYWEPLIPRKFPMDGDLLKRMPVPVFFANDVFSVAIHTSGGDSKFMQTLVSTSKLSVVFDTSLLSAVAIFCDADMDSAEKRCGDLIAELQEEEAAYFCSLFSDVKAPGVVVGTSPRVGIHVFPDNENQGTIESMLLDCANVTYPNLLMRARDYVGAVDEAFTKKWAPADGLKATVGCIANVLRPGKANQVTIQDNKWICTETLNLVPVQRLTQFITDLLDLSPKPSE